MNPTPSRLVTDRSIIEAIIPQMTETNRRRVVIDLLKARKKVFKDAWSCLDSVINKNEISALRTCDKCSSLVCSKVNHPICINGDVLEVLLARIAGRPRHKSPDFVLFEFDNSGNLVAHITEAKLGETGNQKPRNPQLKELQEKFNSKNQRLSTKVVPGNCLFFIVPKDSYQGQRSRVWRWNYAGAFSPQTLVCLCPRAFLDHFSIPCKNQVACEKPLIG